MIKSFADKVTRDLYELGSSKKVPQDVTARAIRKLDAINAAETLADLNVPPSNRLHSLSGDRKGHYSISVNDQWRICFRFIGNEAFDVQFCDYH